MPSDGRCYISGKWFREQYGLEKYSLFMSEEGYCKQPGLCNVSPFTSSSTTVHDDIDDGLVVAARPLVNININTPVLDDYDEEYYLTSLRSIDIVTMGTVGRRVRKRPYDEYEEDDDEDNEDGEDDIEDDDDDEYNEVSNSPPANDMFRRMSMLSQVRYMFNDCSLCTLMVVPGMRALCRELVVMARNKLYSLGIGMNGPYVLKVETATDTYRDAGPTTTSTKAKTKNKNKTVYYDHERHDGDVNPPTYGFVNPAVTYRALSATVDEWRNVRYPLLDDILRKVEEVLTAQTHSFHYRNDAPKIIHQRQALTFGSTAECEDNKLKDALWTHLCDKCSCTTNIRRTHVECDVYYKRGPVHSCPLPQIADALDILIETERRVDVPIKKNTRNGSICAKQFKIHKLPKVFSRS